MSSRLLLKHGLKAHHSSPNSTCSLWRTKFDSFSDSTAGGASIVRQRSLQINQIQRSKSCSHFNHKAKELGLQTPSIVSSGFSSTTSSNKLGLISWYLAVLKSRPIVTKSITCAIIYTAADLSSQTIIGRSSEPYDLVRTLRMASYGMLILGPSLHFWFNFVSRVLPKRDLVTTLKKIVMGQTLYGPAMTGVFFSTNAALQGESSTEIVARLKRDFVPTMISGVMYWPLCDFVTFKFIPVHLQPLVSNGFSYLWTVYMTYMASREKRLSYVHGKKLPVGNH